MLNPLSIFTYYFRNKRKVVPILLMITLSVLGISVVAAMSGTMKREVAHKWEAYEHYYTVDIFFNADSGYENFEEFSLAVSNVREELELRPEVYYLLEGRTRSIKVQLLLGSDGTRIFFLSKKDIPKFLEEMEVEIGQENFPKSGKEILLTDSILENKDLKPGDYVGDEIDKQEFLSGKYKIIGEIKSKSDEKNSKFGIGLLDSGERSKFFTTFFVHPEFGQEQALHDYLLDLEKNNKAVSVRTKQLVQEMVTSDFDSTNQILWIINIVVVLTITSAIALLQIIFFMQRSSEFGLLAAIGYSKRFIILRTIGEALGTVVIGWTFGIVFSEVVYRIVNHYLFYPKGMEGLTILEPLAFIFTVPIPVVVAIFSAGTVLWKLGKMDPVTVIEKRD